MKDLCNAWSEAAPRQQQRIVARALEKIAGPLRPIQLNETHAGAIVLDWKNRTKPMTAYNYAATLRQLLRFLKRGDIKLPHLRKPGPRTIIATPDELTRVLEHASPWMRVLLLLAAHAGLRASDCLRAAPIHYNRENKTLNLYQQKTGTLARLPLTDELTATIEAIPADEPEKPLYAIVRGKTISKKGFCSAWNTLKKKSGVNPGLWIHNLRRTLAVSLYEVSKDLRVVEHMLGHRSLASTAQYLEHRDPQMIKQVLDQLWKPKGPVQ